MRTIPLLFTASLLASLASAQATKINDVVLKKDGSRLRGVEVTEFTLTGVRGKRGAEAFEVPAHQVLAIEWSNAPEPLVLGKAAMDRGDFKTAAQLLGDVQSDRALVKADAEFFKVKAAVNGIGADTAAASTAAEHARKWLAGNASHWRTPEALWLCGRAERLAGAGTAAATLRDLDDRATKEGFGAVWSARAKTELALTLLAENKAGDARTTFQSASAAADTALGSPTGDETELKALKALARVGEGETYLAEKDYAKAESFFRGLASGNQPELVAAGLAGEGESIFQAAVAANRPDDLRRAQICFAKASVADSVGGEASAKANYYLGRCLLALGPEKEGDNFKQRANAYFQIVAANYPTSRWAGQAKAEQAK